jgi:hypothetical protein
MTCDDVLPALEMGDAALMEEARRHVQDCPGCAAALERWLALKSALAVTPRLIDRERFIWREARRESFVRSRSAGLWAIGAVAIAASVVIALSWPRPGHVSTLAPPIEALAFSTELANQELAALDRQLDQIDSELKTLSNRVALVDAKREAADLLNQYRQ